MSANPLVKVRDNLFGDGMMQALKNTLPDNIKPEKLVQVMWSAITKSPDLQRCTPESLYTCAKELGQLGLVPDGVLGEAYLVAYSNRKKGTKEATVIVGYRGLMTLAVRSGKVSHIEATLVYEHDSFECIGGLKPRLVHEYDPFASDRGRFIGAYAVAYLIDNPEQPAYAMMSANEIEAIRNKSRGKDQAPWREHTDEMRKKTVIRRLCKGLPMSSEMLAAAVRGEYHAQGVLGQEPAQKSSFGFPVPEAQDVEIEVSDAPEPAGVPSDAELKDAGFGDEPNPDDF